MNKKYLLNNNYEEVISFLFLLKKLNIIGDFSIDARLSGIIYISFEE